MFIFGHTHTHTIWCNEFRTPFNFRLHVCKSTVGWQSGSAPLLDVKQSRSTSSSSSENIAQFTTKSHYVAKSSFGFSTIFIVRELDLLSALRIDCKKPWSPPRNVSLWITTMPNEIFLLCLYLYAICARKVFLPLIVTHAWICTNRFFAISFKRQANRRLLSQKRQRAFRWLLRYTQAHSRPVEHMNKW